MLASVRRLFDPPSIDHVALQLLSVPSLSVKMNRLFQLTYRAVATVAPLHSASRPASSLFARQLPRSFATKTGADKDFVPAAVGEENEDAFEEEENLLEGKRTRESIHSAFASRAMASMRYEYFAQRAELDAELEAASTFRGLTESAKQQALGYMELMEEYGDADFGSTMDNLEVSAEQEREHADTVCKNNAIIAADEDFEQLEEWFDDMATASARAADRLDLTTSMIDAEMLDGDAFDVEDDNDIPEKVKS